MSSLPNEWVDPNPPATLADGLLRLNLSPRFCLQVTCGIHATSWQTSEPMGGSPIAGVYYRDLGDGASQVNDTVDEIVNVFVNGVAVPQTTNPSDFLAGHVGHTTGAWYMDWVHQQIVLILPPPFLGQSPMQRGLTVELLAMYRFSDGPTGAGGYRWRPYLTGLPTLTRRVAADFNGIVQIGGGAITFQNETHFFDSRLKQNWDAGTATVIMGCSQLPWAQFKTLATFTPSSPKLTDNAFVLNVQDPKVLIDTLFPTVVYDSQTYPNIDPAALGNPIPLAYGTILGIVPTCIDQTALTFKVASHAIKSFDGVRVLEASSGVWNDINFASTNLALAQFTLNSVDWAVGTTLVVDFSGMKRANGSLMDNPSEITLDLITRLGQPTDAAGFESARLWYDAGYIGNSINRKTVHAPSIYLDTQASALKTIEDIMVNVRAYLITNALGQFSMVPFRNYQAGFGATGLIELDDTNTLEPGIVVDGAGTSSYRVQAGQKTTQCQVNFGIRKTEGLQQTVTYSNETNRYTRGLQQDVPVVIDSIFTTEEDALYLAQAKVNEYRVDPYIYKASLKWLAFLATAAMHAHVTSARHNIDVVCEILQVDLDLTGRKATLTLNNLRGFEESTGFWVLSTDLTPSGASLAWPANGQLSDPAETQFRRHQAGHWHQVNDFPLDPTSASDFSDLDYSVSRMQ